MNATLFSKFLPLMAILPILFTGETGRAQTPAEVRAAFKNLHDDKVRDNCGEAAAWLMARRDTLKGALLTEVYQTDWQGREAIVWILLKTNGFVPDERFNQAIMKPAMLTLPPEHGSFPIGAYPWEFIEAHYEMYEPQLLNSINPAGKVRNIWVATWFLKKHNALAKHLDLYTPEVLDQVADGMKGDTFRFNASQAVRTFLILGPAGVPTLQKASKSTDPQTSSLARATLDAMKGNRDAFGFLDSRLWLTTTPYGPSAPAPDWLLPLSEANRERATYP